MIAEVLKPFVECEDCWARHLRSPQGPPPALAAALEEIDVEEAA